MFIVIVRDKMKRTHKDRSFKMMSLTLQHFCMDDNVIPDHRHLGSGFFFLFVLLFLLIKISYLECMFNFRAPWHVLLLF